MEEPPTVRLAWPSQLDLGAIEWGVERWSSAAFSSASWTQAARSSTRSARAGRPGDPFRTSIEFDRLRGLEINRRRALYEGAPGAPERRILGAFHCHVGIGAADAEPCRPERRSGGIQN